MTSKLSIFAAGFLFAVLAHLAFAAPVFAADAVNHDDPKMQEAISGAGDATMAAKTGTSIDCPTCIKDHADGNSIDGKLIEPEGTAVTTPTATSTKTTK
ncbi:hypothetical protein BH10BDE1_BH10BDE1_21440 [soil metagenome]